MSGNGTKAKLSPQEETARSGTRGGGGIVEFIKFGLVGVMNTAVDFLVYTVLLWVGVHYLASQLISYSAGTLNSYAVNKLWTFKGQGSSLRADRKSTRAEFIRFLALNGGTLLLSVVLLYVSKEGLGLPPLLAKLLVTGVTVAANYAGSKLWVFR